MFSGNSIMKSGAKNIVEDILKVKQNEFIFISDPFSSKSMSMFVFVGSKFMFGYTKVQSVCP